MNTCLYEWQLVYACLFISAYFNIYNQVYKLVVVCVRILLAASYTIDYLFERALCTCRYRFKYRPMFAGMWILICVLYARTRTHIPNSKYSGIYVSICLYSHRYVVEWFFFKVCVLCMSVPKVNVLMPLAGMCFLQID